MEKVRKPDGTIVGVVTTTCTCGGVLGANMDGVLTHSMPTCKDYDAVASVDDAASLLERCRVKNARS